MHLEYVPTIFSNLFRVAAFIFLRVVPLSAGKVVLPVLYVKYLLASWLCPPPEEDGGVQRLGRLGTLAEKSVRLRMPPAPSGWKDNLRTIILSLPTPSSYLRKTNLLVNTLLLLGAVEFVIRPFFDTASDVTFTRVGAVYPDSVKIVVRYPEANTTEHKVRVIWRETRSNSDKWKKGPVLKLNEENDWVNTGLLSGLWPSTSYEYKLSSINKTHLSYPPTPIQFRTFPDPRLPTGNHFRFLVSSGVAPNFPYLPFQSRTIKGFDLMAKYLFSSAPAPEPKGPSAAESANSTTTNSETVSKLLESPSSTAHAEFLMLLGNFVHPDIPNFTSDLKEAYRRYYRRNYQTTYRKVYERLPVFHTHDFSKQANGSASPNVNASDVFKTYIADANYDSWAKGQNYYDFRYGDVAFFVLDTHDPKVEGGHSMGTMLGDKQLGALYEWLARANATATFKFIVSTVPLTSLGGTQKNSWTAFASEKASLLHALHSVPNVIVLSGDRHEFAAIEFNSEASHNTVVELSTSPLSNFYIPFWRSLRSRTVETIQRTKKPPGGGLGDVATTVEELPKERLFKYILLGNYKWSTIEVDTRDLEKPALRLEVMVGGSSAYKLDIVGSPVKLYSSSALGAFVPGSIKSMFDKIGMKPKKWF